jgi:hypothetical protein
MHLLVKPIASAVALVLLLAGQGHAGILIFNRTTNGGLAGFNTAAGAPPISIDFDGIAPGTNLNGMTLAGVTFQPSATGAPLLVVPGNDTFTPSGFSGVDDPATNRLFPTSGANVLSPGGLRLGPSGWGRVRTTRSRMTTSS